jgi:phage terminase large subunit-like protein
MSAAVHTVIRAGIKRIHLIAPTTADFHDVNVEGKSGISNLYFTSHASTEYKASPGSRMSGALTLTSSALGQEMKNEVGWPRAVRPDSGHIIRPSNLSPMSG